MGHSAERYSCHFLLAAVAHRFGDEPGAIHLRELARNIPPTGINALGEDAAYHELEPLLHLVASDCSMLGQPLDLPERLTARWSRVYEREVARCSVIHVGAAKALTALAQAGIRVVPLKGFYLASRLYERKGARAFRDLDLLVEPGALTALNEVLLRAGFRPHPGRPVFVPAPAYTVYHLPLEGSDTVMEVDIHVGMHWPEEYNYRTAFRAEDLWSQVCREEVEGLPAWGLSPQHLFITTLLDAAVNHRYARLIKFRDAIEIIRGSDVGWAEVLAWSRRWMVRSFVGAGLRYLVEIDSDLAIPPFAMDSSLPDYATMRAFLRALPATGLPHHRSRSFSLPNLLFFVLSDTPHERARGLLNVPFHMLRGRRRF